MNHRTYDGQRFSPLARVNKGNVKNLRLDYAVALGDHRQKIFRTLPITGKKYFVLYLSGAVALLLGREQICMSEGRTDQQPGGGCSTIKTA